MKAPLEGVRVLDLSRETAGPYGSLLLADLGAEVIRIEHPQSKVRQDRAILDKRVEAKYDFTINGIGTHFLSMNRNKKSVALNMRSEKGREIFLELVRKSDVVYDNYRPGVTKRIGIDYESLSKINPRIITCSITGFGDSGPLSTRPAFDTIVQAMGGGMSITTAEDGRPIRPGIPIGDLGGSMHGVIGILSALYAREKTGRGQEVQVSMLDVQISLLIYMVTDYFASGEVWGPSGLWRRADATHAWYKCKDGEYIAIAAVTDTFFENLCRAIGREDLLADPRFSKGEIRAKNKDQLGSILSEVFLTKTVAEWEKILTEADVPCGPVNTIDKALNNPQVIHRKMVVSYPHPVEGEVKAAGNPIRLSEHEQVYTPPPLLGQHTVEILSGLLGYTQEELARLKEEGIIGYP